MMIALLLRLSRGIYINRIPSDSRFCSPGYAYALYLKSKNKG